MRQVNYSRILYCYIARSIVVEVEFLLLLLLLMPTRPFLAAAVSPIGASDWAPLSLGDLIFFAFVVKVENIIAI